ncbi:MAG: hypothetical protein KJ666_17525 [Bacteroidetes bacterium]|nr:hypothetical protein [Bacteroidota bacterium]MBU2583900.1 hypothetical protein [Bacteroidota bacterium]
MNNFCTKYDVVLHGEIVEAFESEGQRFAKISISPTYMEIPTQSLNEAHLGDKLILKTQIIVEKIENDLFWKS